MRTIAIAGYASSSRLDINDEPETTEIWGLNRSHEFLSRVNGYFQIHPRNWHGDKRGLYGRPESHMKFLTECSVPVWMLYPDERVPKAEKYPRDEVVKMLGRDYLMSTFSYALGLALHQGVDEVKFFGTELATFDEFVNQRPALEWMIGWAEGRGVKVTIPDDCLLLHGPAYPQDAQAVKSLEKRMYSHKSIYMANYAGFCSAMGAAKASRSLGRIDQAEVYENIAGRFGVACQERKGMMKEVFVRLNELGLTDTTSVTVPALIAPPSLDEPPILDEMVVQVPG